MSAQGETLGQMPYNKGQPQRGDPKFTNSRTDPDDVRAAPWGLGNQRDSHSQGVALG